MRGELKVSPTVKLPLYVVGDTDFVAGAAHVLMVSPAPTLDPEVIRSVGLDPERLREVWQSRTGEEIAPVRAFDQPDDRNLTCALTQPVLATTKPPVPARPAATQDESEPLDSSSRATFSALGLRASLPAMPFRYPGNALATGAIREVVHSDAAVIVAQGYPGGGQALWTVVTAPSAPLLKVGVDCLTQAAIWANIGGQMSGLNSNETVSVYRSEETSRFITTQPIGFSNLRLVAAGWLSLNAVSYVLLALLAVAGVAASTYWLVLNVGRRQE